MVKFYLELHKRKLHALELKPVPELKHSTIRKDLPTFKAEDVQKHDSPKKGIWVTYGLGVYDITKFIPEHPGSDKGSSK